MLSFPIPAPTTPYSELALTDSLIIGAAAPVDVDGEVAHLGDMYAQARLTFDNVRAALLKVDAELDHIASVQVFITDAAKMADFQRAWQETFPVHKPVRVTLVTGVVLEGLLIELHYIATRTVA